MRTKRYVMIPSNNPIWGLNKEYITNWEEGEKLGVLTHGKIFKLGSKNIELYQVYKWTGIMIFSDSEAEAKQLSKQIIKEVKKSKELGYEVLNYIPN